MNQQLNRNTLAPIDTLFPQKTAQQPDQAKADHASGYFVHVGSRWNNKAAQFAKEVEINGATLFQGALWLSTWYKTFTKDSDIEAVIATVVDSKTGELLMLFPLCRHMENGIATISFADFGLADYNSPLVRPGFEPGEKELEKIMDDLCQALPKADLLRLEKIPDFINKSSHPSTGFEGLQDSNLCHYGVEITGDWEDYWASLKRSFRKDQRRRWRVLEKKGEVSFVWCRDKKQIMPLFQTLLDQQQERLEHLGLTQLLADKKMKKFYTQVIEQGCEDGPVIFTALLVDGVPIATLLGLGNGHHYAMTLSGYEMGEWRKCSPGRLLTEHTMQMLHGEGYSYFDFTIGDEPYKEYFAHQHGPLREMYRPLTWKALPHYSWVKLKAMQRQSELAGKIKKRIFGS